MSMPNSPTPVILTEHFVAFPYEVGFVRGASKERYFYLAVANPNPTPMQLLVRLINWTGDELVSATSVNHGYEFTGPWPFRYTLHPGQSVVLRPVVPETTMMGYVDIWSSAQPLLHAWTTVQMSGVNFDIAAIEREIPIRNMNGAAGVASPATPTTPGAPPPARSGPAPSPTTNAPTNGAPTTNPPTTGAPPPAASGDAPPAPKAGKNKRRT